MIAVHSKNQLKGHVAPASLRVAGSLGRWPWIGLLLVMIGGIVFGALAYQVQTQGPWLKWDVPLANSLHAQALSSPAYVKDLMITGFYLGREAAGAIAFLLGAYYLVRRFWRELAMVMVGYGGTGLWWYSLSNLFDRPRPVFPTPIWLDLKSGGFPSGHTLTAVVCYGFLAYMAASQTSSRIWKWMAALLAVGIILFIGYSRLLIGDHYLTDVLAGYAVGVAWSGAVFTIVEYVFKRRKDVHVIQE